MVVWKSHSLRKTNFVLFNTFIGKLFFLTINDDRRQCVFIDTLRIVSRGPNKVKIKLREVVVDLEKTL